jgi:hypothetical protein
MALGFGLGDQRVSAFLTREAVHQIQRSYDALGRIFLTLVLTLIFS